MKSCTSFSDLAELTEGNQSLTFKKRLRNKVEKREREKKI